MRSTFKSKELTTTRKKAATRRARDGPLLPWKTWCGPRMWDGGPPFWQTRCDGLQFYPRMEDGPVFSRLYDDPLFFQRTWDGPRSTECKGLSLSHYSDPPPLFSPIRIDLSSHESCVMSPVSQETLSSSRGLPWTKHRPQSSTDIPQIGGQSDCLDSPILVDAKELVEAKR